MFQIPAAGIFHKRHKIKGTVVLMKRNVLDFNAITSASTSVSGTVENFISTGNVLDINALASTTRSLAGAVGSLLENATDVVRLVVDDAAAIFSRSIALKLISATKSDEYGNGKVGKKTYLEQHLPRFPNLGDRQDAFNIHFEYDADFGIPGAFYVKSNMQVEFFLVSLTLEDIPNHGTIHFVCNSWVYNFRHYKRDRIFFANDTYLPSETPASLVKYREEELENLRGDGTGERKEGDRIYDYDVYNDLGNPDLDDNLARPILGESSTYPYPRRGRTGRKATRRG